MSVLIRSKVSQCLFLVYQFTLLLNTVSDSARVTLSFNLGPGLVCSETHNDR